MRERGDLTCIHEPIMVDNYVNRKAGDIPHFTVDPPQPVASEDIRDHLLTAAQTRT
jgi:hypothetical protein